MEIGAWKTNEKKVEVLATPRSSSSSIGLHPQGPNTWNAMHGTGGLASLARRNPEVLLFVRVNSSSCLLCHLGNFFNSPRFLSPFPAEQKPQENSARNCSDRSMSLPRNEGVKSGARNSQLGVDRRVLHLSTGASPVGND